MILVVSKSLRISSDWLTNSLKSPPGHDIYHGHGGCFPSDDEIFSLSGPIMGTTYNIKLVLPGNSERFTAGFSKPVNSTGHGKVDSQMSTYKSNSELSQFNQFRVGDWFALSTETLKVIKAALLLSEHSKGAYDITVGPLVNLWGFGPQAETH